MQYGPRSALDWITQEFEFVSQGVPTLWSFARRRRSDDTVAVSDHIGKEYPGFKSLRYVAQVSLGRQSATALDQAAYPRIKLVAMMVVFKGVGSRPLIVVDMLMNFRQPIEAVWQDKIACLCSGQVQLALCLVYGISRGLFSGISQPGGAADAECWPLFLRASVSLKWQTHQRAPHQFDVIDATAKKPDRVA
jgi:hypothetical protein